MAAEVVFPGRGGGGGNPFDQDLNTDDAVTFASVSVEGQSLLPGAARCIGPCKMNYFSGQYFNGISMADVDGGTFTLTINGQTTSNIAWNATGAQVIAALEALASIGVGVTQDTFNGPWVNVNSPSAFIFNELVATDFLAMDGANLTGPSAPYESPDYVASSPFGVHIYTPALGEMILDFFHVVKTAYDDSGSPFVYYGDDPTEQSAPAWAVPTGNVFMRLSSSQQGEYTNFSGRNDIDPPTGACSALLRQLESLTGGEVYNPLPTVCATSVPIYTVISDQNGDGTEGELWVWIQVSTPSPDMD